MTACTVKSDHLGERQTGAVVTGDHDDPCLQMVKQTSKNATPLILVKMFHRLVQQYDRALRKPGSGEVEPLGLAKRQLVLSNPAVEAAGALELDVELDRCERSPQCLMGLRAGE